MQRQGHAYSTGANGSEKQIALKDCLFLIKIRSEVFQQQLDQVIVEDLTEASADSIATPMFDLFSMQKRSS